MRRNSLNTTATVPNLRKMVGLATTGAVVLSVAVLTAPADAAALPKKGAACSKSKIGITETGARNTPYICTKSGKSSVWRLTSAGDGGAATAASSKVPQAWAGTFTYTAEGYQDSGVSSVPFSVSGTIWLGLSEGDAKAAYYNQLTITWDAKTADGACVSAGTQDGSSQLAMYDSFKRGNLTLSQFFKLACANGSTQSGAMQAFTTRVPNGLAATSAEFKGSVDYTLRDLNKAATAQPKVTFSFSLTPSTLAARPPSPQRGTPAPAPAA